MTSVRAAPVPFVESVADVALDEALLRIGELSHRLWAVRAAHRPGPRRVLRWRRPRCCCCAQAFPCATTLAAGGAGPSPR